MSSSSIRRSIKEPRPISSNFIRISSLVTSSSLQQNVSHHVNGKCCTTSNFDFLILVESFELKNDIVCYYKQTMMLVFVTVSTVLAFPYPEDAPLVLEEVPANIDDAVADDASLPLVEGDETVDARHHYNSYNRKPSAYRPSYYRPTYSRPAATYHRPAASYHRPAVSYHRPATSYNNLQQGYGHTGHHTNGGYNSGYHSSGSLTSHHQQSSNYYGSNTAGYGYPSNHGSFGGLGWREGQKPGKVVEDSAVPLSDDVPLVQEPDNVETAGPAATPEVVFQQ